MKAIGSAVELVAQCLAVGLYLAFGNEFVQTVIFSLAIADSACSGHWPMSLLLSLLAFRVIFFYSPRPKP